MTLWILFCRMNEKWDTLFTFYARNREDAERQAEKILQEHSYEWLELKEYPYGLSGAISKSLFRNRWEAIVVRRADPKDPSAVVN